MQTNWTELSLLLESDGVAVMPTDTIYGIVGKALSPKVVERIYHIKGRTPDKPFIILISSIQDLKLFGIIPNQFQLNLLEKMWPQKVSIILPCPNQEFFYLHRGKNSLAFRMPQKKDLLKVIKKTGPIIAPSANPEDQAPATSIIEAKQYFGKNVDYYLDEGPLEAVASTLIDLQNDQIKILRQGEYPIKI